jgi:hypothetical protein
MNIYDRAAKNKKNMAAQIQIFARSYSSGLGKGVYHEGTEGTKRTGEDEEVEHQSALIFTNEEIRMRRLGEPIEVASMSDAANDRKPLHDSGMSVLKIAKRFGSHAKQF